MAPENDESYGNKIDTAFSALEQISKEPVYVREMLLGAYATIVSLTDQAQDSGDIGPGEKITTEWNAAKRAGEIAIGKNDGTTAETMRVHAKHCEDILELMRTPEKDRPTKPATTSRAKSGRGKGKR